MRELVFDQFDRSALTDILRLYSRLFLALDGFWFLATRDKYGYDTAIEIEIDTWTNYFSYEAKKMRKAFGIKGNGIADLITALSYSPRTLCVKNKIGELTERMGKITFYNCPQLSAMIKTGTGAVCTSIGPVLLNAYARVFGDIKADILLKSTVPTEGVCCEWIFEGRGGERKQIEKANILTLSKENLVSLIRVYSRLILALDGFWFLSIKEKYGYDDALDVDIKAWAGYFPYEAKRIRKQMGITDVDITGLIDCLKYSPIWHCGTHKIEIGPERGVFSFYDCPSLLAMETGGYEPTCEPAGTVVFDTYVKSLNPKATVKFLRGPPRKSSQDVSCEWEIRLE